MSASRLLTLFPLSIVVALGIVVGVVNASLALAVPANDDFPGETIASLPASAGGDSSHATTQTDEPVTADECPFGFFGFGGMQNTIWWNVTLPDTTMVELTLETDGTWGPFFTVWGPSEFAGGGLSEVTCGGYPAFPGEEIPPVFGAFQASAGTTYHIQVGGIDLFQDGSPTSGPVSLTLEAVAPPPHDHIADAVLIGTLPLSDRESLTGATTEANEPQSPCFIDDELGVSMGNTVWYSYTPAERQYVSVEAASEVAYTAIVVWKGAPGALTEVACNSGLLGFDAAPGTPYYIQIGLLNFEGESGVAGPVDIIFDTFTVPDCPAAGNGQLFEDPLFDAYVPPGVIIPESISVNPRELESVRVVASSDITCITYKMAGPLPTGPASQHNYFVLDADLDLDNLISTGYPTSSAYYCSDELNPPPTIGSDVYMAVALPTANILIELYNFASAEEVEAYVTLGPDTVSVAIPTAFLGDDGKFDMLASSYGPLLGIDCVPNAGKIAVQQVINPRFGDLNCDGVVDGGDVVPILGDAAELGEATSCSMVGEPLGYAYPAGGSALIAGDLDCSGVVTVADALYLMRWLAAVSLDVPAGCPNPLARPS